ncbi:conserved hypothetical protein [Trichinella spiralis]|nr:conserved hypothetical protein [Trichinella spiralis]
MPEIAGSGQPNTTGRRTEDGDLRLGSRSAAPGKVEGAAHGRGGREVGGPGHPGHRFPGFHGAEHGLQVSLIGPERRNERKVPVRSTADVSFRSAYATETRFTKHNVRRENPVDAFFHLSSQFQFLQIPTGITDVPPSYVPRTNHILPLHPTHHLP